MRLRITPINTSQQIDETTLLDLFKAHLRIDEGVDGDDNNLISAYLLSAISNVESIIDAFLFSGEYLVSNQIASKLEPLPIFLNFGATGLVIDYLKLDGEAVSSPEDYIVPKGNVYFIDLDDFPNAKNYEIKFTITETPLRSDAVTTAVMLVGGMLYENREDKSDRWVTVARKLLHPYMLKP
jgi:hypothetical protein